MAAMSPIHDPVIEQTRDWLVRAVIGLNLCPFAKAVHVKQQIRYAVTDASTPAALADALRDELALLRDADPAQIDTTLLIHPQVLADFLDYNDFLDVADDLLQEMDLEGEIQVASFHPDYQFADSDPDDIENFSNRSPYPTLHLLRESSIDRAVEAFPEAEDIYETNMDTLRRLGHAGWRKLFSEG
ncbi:MAG: DUF1415 domain-containing protein [Aquabacterium sp.]|uniref:DUF1415 domain-containing protein n=1 Tax=Aquabacterium sp. TaxID=1872578 RepID=UPI003BAEC815